MCVDCVFNNQQQIFAGYALDGRKNQVLIIFPLLAYHKGALLNFYNHRLREQ